MLVLEQILLVIHLKLMAISCLMVISIWFWVDLNEELDNLPPWRPLALTIRIWRWALGGFGLLFATLTFISLSCLRTLKSTTCSPWLEVPNALHEITEKVFKFLFGANWTEPLAAFVGYIALITYIVGLLQWILIRLPKQGRIAGDF